MIYLHLNNRILENWPNTYTFTKAITENLISTNENHLPISIFRPSISKCLFDLKTILLFEFYCINPKFNDGNSFMAVSCLK